MEEIWKGAFLPTFRKHVLSVTFIPIDEMTSEDWKIFDYGALRPSARENVDRLIVSGRMDGFYVVDIDMHNGKDKPEHGGKPTYYHPGPENMDESLEDFQTPERFGGGIDQDLADQRRTTKVEELLGMLGLLSKDQLSMIIDELASDPKTPYSEIDKSLELDHLRLIAAIGLFSTGPVEARKVLAPLDTLASDVYAILNSND